MPRYKDMPVGRLTPQRRIRIINHHRPTGTWVTVTGPILEVITEEYKRVSILQDAPNRRVEMRPVAVKMGGDITMAIVPRSDWDLASLEEELPDLPARTGSVIKIDERAAVLRCVDHDGSVGTYKWFWADGTGSPSARELDNAEIIHTAR